MAAMLGAAGGAGATQLFHGAEAGLFHDDNVSRAQRNLGVLSDWGLNANATLGWSIPIGERSSFSVSGTARTTQFKRFSSLDVLSLGGTLAYHTKFGLGPFVPRASVSGSVAAERYGDTARDGQRTRLSFDLGRRVSEEWDVSAGFAMDRHVADNVPPPTPLFSRDVYSIRGRTLFARAEYTLSARWLGFAAVSTRRGDVVSSSFREPSVFIHSAALANDPAFGPDHVAYRLGGRTGSATVGASLATSPRSSLNLALTHETTAAQSGIAYRSTYLNASFLYAY
jgi:hypothetical protein